jgi:hypothetical protein
LRRLKEELEFILVYEEPRKVFKTGRNTYYSLSLAKRLYLRIRSNMTD